jgi:hypothetical protein
MDEQQGGGTPPQYSSDGRWWWDGQRWVAVQHAPTVAPGAATRTRMPHQRSSFWIGLGVVSLAVVGFGACMAAASNTPGAEQGARAASATSTQTAVLAASPSATPTPTPAPTAAQTAAPTAAPPVAAAAPPTAAPAPPAPAGCYPLSNSGTCYEPGEFCRATDHGRTGRAGDGEAIVCEYNNGWRWEPA